MIFVYQKVYYFKVFRIWREFELQIGNAISTESN
jgi:hypothetical protein